MTIRTLLVGYRADPVDIVHDLNLTLVDDIATLGIRKGK